MRFEDEKIGESSALYEEDTFFKPITTSTSETKDVMKRELEKVKEAVKRLPAQITDVVYFIQYWLYWKRIMGPPLRCSL